jgi:Reverse transcriptase (RNA-dependent DNA polymerase)
LIDHIFYFDGTDNKELITIKSGNLLEDITDHLPSYALIIRKRKLKSSGRPVARIFSSKNVNEFVGRLEAVDWDLVLGETDVNIGFNKFIVIMQNTFIECFYIVRISRKRANDKKWITGALRRSSTNKNKLYKCWLISKGPDDESNYKQYCKVFKQTALAARKLYYNEIFDAKSNSVKQLRQNLNEIASFKERKSFSNSISQLKNCKYETLTESKAISNELNQYYSTVGAKLVEDLISNNTLSNSHRVYCKNFVKNSIFCDPVLKLELKKLIENSRDRKAPGPDNISNKLVKQAAVVLQDPLVYIYNLSFCTGIVPDKLKLAKVIPIFKKGDPWPSGNYRPVSLLIVFDKLLEKLMYSWLYNYLELNKVLYQYWLGFRPNRATCHVLIGDIDNIYDQLDARFKVCGIYLDMQKAFDSVSHDILLDKLYLYGIRGVVHDWFRSYLLNRQQCVFINNICSDICGIKYGVPQGSVLGLLLFLIYVNVIGNALLDARIKLFADDTNLFVYSASTDLLYQTARNCIAQLYQWFIVNTLTLNLSKTCYIIFSKAQNQDEVANVVDNVKLILNV